MGTFGYNERTLAALVTRRATEIAGDEWEVLALRKTAFAQRCWWLLGKSDGSRLVVLDLVRRSGPGFTVKTITENEGPVYYDCPLELLTAPEPSNEYARTWRAEVRARANRAAQSASIQIGDTVRIRDRAFRVIGLPTRAGASFIIADEQGKRYRATATEFDA